MIKYTIDLIVEIIIVVKIFVIQDKNTTEAKSATIVTMTNDELINSFLLADLGRYLVKLETQPHNGKAA